MNKKIFLTSAVIMCMACPAIAETFPQDGNMLANKTYANAAVYDNTGIYEGDVTADAEYSLNPYSVSAGSYMFGLNSNNTAMIALCTSGNYCPGVTNTTYDAENSAFVDDGLKACPANYSGSVAGATANTDCYRACATTDVAKSASVSGQMYYNGTSGDGVNACEPLTCVNGWHVKEGVPDLNILLKDTYATQNSANQANGNSYSGNGTTYGISGKKGAFVSDYAEKGIIYGHGRCSTQQGYRDTVNNNNDTFNNPTTFASLTDEAGQTDAKYCYCQVDAYTPYGGTQKSMQSSWVFLQTESDVSYCSTYCAVHCANGGVGGNTYAAMQYRKAIFNTIPTSLASCEANTINITWNDASAEDIAATGAATTVYEGDIKTPLKAITKPGKTFVGWKFVKPVATPVEP